MGRLRPPGKQTGSHKNCLSLKNGGKRWRRTHTLVCPCTTTPFHNGFYSQKKVFAVKKGAGVGVEGGGASLKIRLF